MYETYLDDADNRIQNWSVKFSVTSLFSQVAKLHLDKAKLSRHALTSGTVYSFVYNHLGRVRQDMGFRGTWYDLMNRLVRFDSLYKESQTCFDHCYNYQWHALYMCVRWPDRYCWGDSRYSLSSSQFAITRGPGDVIPCTHFWDNWPTSNTELWRYQCCYPEKAFEQTF